MHWQGDCVFKEAIRPAGNKQERTDRASGSFKLPVFVNLTIKKTKKPTFLFNRNLQMTRTEKAALGVID